MDPRQRLAFTIRRIDGPIAVDFGQAADGEKQLEELELFRCGVQDVEHKGLEGVFEYQLWRYADGSTDLGLRSVQIGPVLRPNILAYPPIAISMVRDLPLGLWETAARGAVKIFLNRVTRGSLAALAGSDEVIIGPVSDDVRNRMAEEMLQLQHPDIDSSSTPAARRRAASLRSLARVGIDYLLETSFGRPDPAVEIARIHDVPPSTARSWIHRARKAGFIGPAVGRQAGEAQSSMPQLEDEDRASSDRAAMVVLRRDETHPGEGSDK